MVIIALAHFVPLRVHFAPSPTAHFGPTSDADRRAEPGVNPKWIDVGKWMQEQAQHSCPMCRARIVLYVRAKSGV